MKSFYEYLLNLYSYRPYRFVLALYGAIGFLLYSLLITVYDIEIYNLTVGGTKARLNWEYDSTGVAGFFVDSASTLDGKFSPIAKTTVNTYLDSKLEPGHERAYKIRSLGRNDSISGYSNPVSVTTLSDTTNNPPIPKKTISINLSEKPAAPTNLTATIYKEKKTWRDTHQIINGDYTFFFLLSQFSFSFYLPL